jgi:capsular polysaccharide biosynthesis protein
VEIGDYRRILRRRAWIPLSLTATVVVITGLLTLMSKPDYIATATVIVKNDNSNSANSQTLSFPEIATSNTLVLRVRNQLHLTEDVDTITHRINVSGGNGLYRVAVNDSSPGRATIIANAVAQEAARLYKQLSRGSDASATQDLQAADAAYRAQYLAAAKALLDFQQQHPDAEQTRDTGIHAELLLRQMDEKAKAQAYQGFQAEVTRSRVDAVASARNLQSEVVDEAAARPNTGGRYLKIIYAAALALVVGFGLVFALEYLDNSIRGPEDAEKLVEAPLIGVIPRASARTLRPARGTMPGG